MLYVAKTILAISAIKKNNMLYVAKTILTRIKGWQDDRITDSLII